MSFRAHIRKACSCIVIVKNCRIVYNNVYKKHKRSLVIAFLYCAANKNITFLVTDKYLYLHTSSYGDIPFLSATGMSNIYPGCHICIIAIYSYSILYTPQAYTIQYIQCNIIINSINISQYSIISYIYIHYT